MQQVLGAAGLRDGDGDILRPQSDGRHGLHVRVRVGGGGHQQAEELVLRIAGYRTGGAKAVELDTACVGQGGDGLLNGHGIQTFTHVHQGGQGGIEDLVRQGVDAVVLVDRELPEAGAGSKALRQLELEILKSAAANRAAEAYDGGLADTDLLRQVSHG